MGVSRGKIKVTQAAESDNIAPKLQNEVPLWVMGGVFALLALVAFTVLSVEHEASNNLGAEAARLLGRGTIERGTYKNRFDCVLAAVPVVPRHRPSPTAPAALSARVVGVDGSVVTGERGHRVKVQMHFQRGQRPNAGGGPTRFGADAAGNAPRAAFGQAPMLWPR